MKTAWLQHGKRTRALVFFAGWGMDDRPFRRLTSSHYDVCVCYDYRKENAKTDLGSAAADPVARAPVAGDLASVVDEQFAAIRRYDEITVIAWSFGCAVAAQIMAHSNWPLRHALAINGTVTPEDDHVGIPKRWLDATAENLHDEGWPKFVRRMCLGKAARQDFADHAPERDQASLVAELDVLRQITAPAQCRFTRALVGTKDRIILPENQQRCWDQLEVPVQTIAAPHYPFHLWNTWDELLTIAL